MFKESLKEAVKQLRLWQEAMDIGIYKESLGKTAYKLKLDVSACLSLKFSGF